VTLADERRTETTDAEGRFEFRGLAAKRYEVIVRKLGYVFADTVVEIADEENRSIQVRLVRGTNLDSVSVRERGGMMSSFDEHRKIGLGQFLTREELDKVRGAMLGSVLSQFRGTKIMVGRGNYSAVASSRGGTSLNGDGLRGLKPACYSTVILDNMVVYSEKAGRPGNQALFMINEMSPDQLEGVEFYQGPAQIPDRYSGLDLSCGLLVLWTRRTFAP
jgi:hypothetical protein